MSKEDFISIDWASEERSPDMDARPQPEHSRGHFDPKYATVLEENRHYESIAMEKVNFENRMLKEAINRLAQSEDGYRVFRWLCSHLAFKGTILAMTNGQIDTKALLFNEARRIIWQNIRDLLSLQNRNRLEEDV
jgi:hypothetical protein